MTTDPAARRGRWMLFAVVALGVLLHLPAFRMGFYADDAMHQLALEGHLPLAKWSLFDFGGVAEWSATNEAVGGFPWWTSPDWKIRFFRPLASVSLWLDHALWGSEPAGYHATSLVLFAALLLVSHAMYRALGLGRGVALGATAFLAVSQSALLPVNWVANRNTVLAALFTAGAVATLASHARLGRGRALGAAFLLAVSACLSKESGVVAFGLIALYLVVVDRDLPQLWARRAAAAAVVVGFAYVIALAVAGFGTHSVFYATPWSDPGRFAANFGLLLTTGALALVTPVMPDVVPMIPDTAPFLVGAAVVIVTPLAVWAGRRLRGDRVAGFFAAWAVVSMVPESAALPSDRLLLTATVGGGGLLAMLVARTLPKSEGRPRRERALAAALLVSAGVLEALMTAGQGAFLADAAARTRAVVRAADVGPPSLGRREILVLQADDPIVPFAIASTWAFETRDVDVYFSILQTGGRALRWAREDARTMVFTSLDEPFVTRPFETVYRTGEAPPPAGTRVTTPAFEVEVVETAPAGGVRTVRLRWKEPPDAERFRFLVPRGGRLTHVVPPPPGASADLPAIAPTNPLMR